MLGNLLIISLELQLQERLSQYIAKIGHTKLLGNYKVPFHDGFSSQECPLKVRRTLEEPMALCKSHVHIATMKHCVNNASEVLSTNGYSIPQSYI